ncbi:MAG: Ycf66 family protein [Coleofasciculaceae cyanobacterium]
MVNVGFNSAAILGIFLAVAGAGLYFLRTIRPELSRDQDIFFAAVGVLCGCILLFQGWRLDPILLFGQVLLTGSAAFFAFEAIRLRGIATEQAKRNTPIEDYERPVSKVYRTQEAELYDYEELEPSEARYRRLRGTPDPRERDTERYEEEARSPRSRRSPESYGTEERATRRRPTRRSSRTVEPSVYSVDAQLELDSDWEEKPTRTSRTRREPPSVDAQLDSDWEERPTRTSRTRPSRPGNPDIETGSTRARRRRPTSDQVSSRSTRGGKTSAQEPPTDVDYQPIDPSQENDDLGAFED